MNAKPVLTNVPLSYRRICSPDRSDVQPAHRGPGDQTKETFFSSLTLMELFG